MLVYQCVHELVPAYLPDALQPVAGLPGRQSTTPALIIDLDTGCTTDTALYDR